MLLKDIKIPVVIFLLFLSMSAHPQLKSVIHHYSAADGLSDNRVRCIIKDKEGFMWFGTWSGINRFDGHNFLSFKSYPGDRSDLKSNRVNQIVDGQTSFLWIQTYDNQIYRFDKRTELFTSLCTLAKDPRLESVRFSKILYADSASVWLQSEEGIFLVETPAQKNVTCKRFAATLPSVRSLPSDSVLFFLLDRSKNAWVGTSRGICLLEKQQNGDYERAALQGADSPVCTAAAEDGKGCWFSSREGAVVYVNAATKSVEKINVSQSPLNNVLVSGKGDKIFFTSASGALITMSAERKFLGAEPITPGMSLHTIYEDGQGILWIEPALYGVVMHDPATRVTRHFTQENYANYLRDAHDYAVWEDNSGLVWVYMKGCGLGYYDREKDKLEYFHNDPRDPNKQFSNMVATWYYDPAGVLWLSTEDWGVEKIVFQRNDFRQTLLYTQTLNRVQNEVRGLLTDHLDRLWVGTKAGQLFVYDNGQLQQNMFIDPPSIPTGIYTMLEDRKGNIWVGTKLNGLYKAEPLDSSSLRYRFFHYGRHHNIPGAVNVKTIYALLEDRKGRIWGGSYGDGLILIRDEKGAMPFSSAGGLFANHAKGNYGRVRCLEEDKMGNIWIGTTEGLLVFNPDEGNRFMAYKKIQGDIRSLGGNDVQFIYKDRNGTMWVCTSSGGLNKAVTADPLKNIRFENYSTRNGLPSDYILSCTEDNDHNLWMSTQNGISRLSVSNDKIQNFGVYDGLSNTFFSEASCTRLQNGEIIFGAGEGFWSFAPAEMGERKLNVNLAFTNLQVNNVDVFPSDSSLAKYAISSLREIALRYDQNTISIDFAVLDYRLGESDNYVYRLTGFDKTWNISKGRRRATYTNLPPGNYVFEVRSQTEHLYQSTPQRQLAITILPPPWKTWWAYLAYCLLALALFIAGRKITLTMLRLKHRIAVERKMADLKLGFFTQVSHELRTPLTLIVNPAEEVLQHEKLSEQGAVYMSVVVKNARRMVRFINQLLDLRKAESGSAQVQLSAFDIISFTRNIVGYFREVAEKRNIKMDVHADVAELLLRADAEKLDIVLYNLLGNAIKFSEDGGLIGVDITITPERLLKISVSDNGTGVPEEELEKIFGLYYEAAPPKDQLLKGTGIGLALSRELVELQKGRIYARNNALKGLTIVIELPYLPAEATEADAQVTIDTVMKLLEEQPSHATPLVKADDDDQERPLVLLVEDNTELREFLSIRLAAHYKVASAADGEEGLQKAQELLPDLVLSDIMMPRMNGIQLLDKLKNDGNTSHIPVVLLTARSSVESQVEGLRYGADFYISKPFPMGLLQSAISNLIRQRRKLFEALSTGKTIRHMSASQDVVTAYDRQFLEKIIGIVNNKLSDGEFNIDDVADAMMMSRSAFYKKFKSLTNMAPVEFVRETRLNRAKALFDSGGENISAVAYTVGFNNPKYFSTCFKARFHQTPSEYLRSLSKAADSH